MLASAMTYLRQEAAGGEKGLEDGQGTVLGFENLETPQEWWPEMAGGDLRTDFYLRCVLFFSENV